MSLHEQNPCDHEQKKVIMILVNERKKLKNNF